MADALHQHWDPIGFGVPADEYDSYAPAVTGMLERGETDGQIAQYLVRIESDVLGLEPQPIEMLERVAGELRRAATASAGEADDGGPPSILDGPWWKLPP